jgi:hypothetical protein
VLLSLKTRCRWSPRNCCRFFSERVTNVDSRSLLTSIREFKYIGILLAIGLFDHVLYFLSSAKPTDRNFRFLIPQFVSQAFAVAAPTEIIGNADLFRGLGDRRDSNLDILVASAAREIRRCGNG